MVLVLVLRAPIPTCALTLGAPVQPIGCVKKVLHLALGIRRILLCDCSRAGKIMQLDTMRTHVYPLAPRLFHRIPRASSRCLPSGSSACRARDAYPRRHRADALAPSIWRSSWLNHFRARLHITLFLTGSWRACSLRWCSANRISFRSHSKHATRCKTARPAFPNPRLACTRAAKHSCTRSLCCSASRLLWPGTWAKSSRTR